MQFSPDDRTILDRVRQHFLLDPEITFLNHGSYGACPRPVFEAYQAWQRELERQPVEFLGRRSTELMAHARARLAQYLGCAHDEVVYFPNPTTALNMVARSLTLGSGDEVLASDHEYGAMDRTWQFICQRRGAQYVRREVRVSGLPEEAADGFWEGVSPNTRVIFLSHITSVTAVEFPVREICRLARAAGILTVIDGAHAPGQIALDLSRLGADIYVGACHKWLCAPKGSSFLYARRTVQHLLEPLVVSWGWESDEPSGSPMVDHHEWQGTRDPAAFLSVPTAIDFQIEHDWERIRRLCHQMALETYRAILPLRRSRSVVKHATLWHRQMFSARIAGIDAANLHRRLLEEHAVEVLVDSWKEHTVLRFSFQGYNTPDDGRRLVQALTAILQ